MHRPDASARLAARTPDGRSKLLMRQRWDSLLFLHWRMPVDRIAETLPRGLYVDVFDGAAWIAIVPFFMRRVRPARGPSVPWISNFLELNVRTYVHDDQGIPGVWFYSLDCNQPFAVIAARCLMGLPYLNAQMSARDAGMVEYRSRRSRSSASAEYVYGGAGEAQMATPESLEFFLLERYYLYALRRGTLVRGQVAHEPYRYRAAEVRAFSTLPLRLDGFDFDEDDKPEHACFADGFEVEIFGAGKI